MAERTDRGDRGVHRIERARRLGQRVDAGWRREDVEAQLARLHARKQQRARRAAIATPIAAAMIAAVLTVIVTGGQAPSPGPAPTAPAAALPIPPALTTPAPPVVPAVADALAERVARLPEVTAMAPDPRPALPAVPVPAPAPPSGMSPGDGRVVTDHVRSEQPVPPAPRTWRAAAGDGDYTAAWDALASAQAALTRMDDLLLAGDVARLSGHADAAVALLMRAVALHAGDPRAPLAAFTLGRVQLEQLGAPREAALAFARALELAPRGPLAEDALAREVEAWSRSGETDTARTRARDYVQRYPDGRRIRAVRQFGGLVSR
jgi:hypothetical protein